VINPKEVYDLGKTTKRTLRSSRIGYNNYRKVAFIALSFVFSELYKLEKVDSSSPTFSAVLLHKFAFWVCISVCGQLTTREMRKTTPHPQLINLKSEQVKYIACFDARQGILHGEYKNQQIHRNPSKFLLHIT